MKLEFRFITLSYRCIGARPHLALNCPMCTKFRGYTPKKTRYICEPNGEIEISPNYTVDPTFIRYCSALEWNNKKRKRL